MKFDSEILLDDLLVRLSTDCPWRDHPRGSGFRSAILGTASASEAGRASAAHDRRRKAIDNAAKALVLVLHLISNTQNLSLRQQIGTKKTYIERKIRKLLVDDVGVDLPIEIHRNQVENVQRHHIYCFDYFPNRLCRC